MLEAVSKREQELRNENLKLHMQLDHSRLMSARVETARQLLAEGTGVSVGVACPSFMKCPCQTRRVFVSAW